MKKVSDSPWGLSGTFRPTAKEQQHQVFVLSSIQCAQIKYISEISVSLSYLDRLFTADFSNIIFYRYFFK